MWDNGLVYSVLIRYIQRTTDFPESAPLCRSCNKRGTSKVTKDNLRNGNAGSRYYRCESCKHFFGFVNARGNDPTNPDCGCKTPSKRLLVGRWDEHLKNPVVGQVFYACRHLKSDFNRYRKTEEKEYVIIDNEELIAELGRLNII